MKLRMQKVWTWLTSLAIALVVFMPTLAMAAKKKGANVVIVADTRELGVMIIPDKK